MNIHLQVFGHMLSFLLSQVLGVECRKVTSFYFLRGLFILEIRKQEYESVWIDWAVTNDPKCQYLQSTDLVLAQVPFPLQVFCAFSPGYLYCKTKLTVKILSGTLPITTEEKEGMENHVLALRVSTWNWHSLLLIIFHWPKKVTSAWPDISEWRSIILSLEKAANIDILWTTIDLPYSVFLVEII